MSFVFTPERWRAMAEHRERDHASLLMAHERPAPRTLRRAYRTYEAHDEDHNRVGDVRMQVDTPLTILIAYRVDVYDAHGMSLELAKACGHKTVSGLRAAWMAMHPRSPLATAAWFRLGDHRDRDRYLTSTRHMRWGPSSAGIARRSSQATRSATDAKRLQPTDIERYAYGDYTSNPRVAADDLPVLSDGEYVVMAAHNRQKDVRRAADLQAANATATLAQRVARIEAGGAVAVALVRHELRSLERAVDRETDRADAA